MAFGAIGLSDKSITIPEFCNRFSGSSKRASWRSQAMMRPNRGASGRFLPIRANRTHGLRLPGCLDRSRHHRGIACGSRSRRIRSKIARNARFDKVTSAFWKNAYRQGA
jgi:hypothetical protein